MSECEVAKWCAYVITSLVAVHLVDVLIKKGLTGVLKAVANFLLLMPGANAAVKAFTKKEVDGYVSQAFNRKPGAKKSVISIPEKGIPVEELKKELEKFKSGDKHLSENGRLFAYVYTSEGPRFNLQREAFKLFTDLTLDGAKDERVEIIHAFMDAFMHDNALNPMVFPALRRFENEVVAMTASMLHGDGDVVGSVTSGGTESILMAMKTYRDRARSINPRITKPTVVAPTTIHPAFEKAAHYFDLTMKHVPVDPETLVCNLQEYEDAIDSNTILLLASAPSYPQAILDPVEAISKIAIRRKLPLHVDACFGGFMLPWVEKLGNNIPKWDFRVDGVTSISADLHKYGYATKGASVVCYRDSSIRKHQFFAYSGWSGGLFASPTMAGTRPGGHLAAAWIALRAMGQDGYMEMARKLLATANKMKSGIKQIEGLKVLGSPLMTAFGFGSSRSDLSIFAVSDIMEQKVLPAPRNLRVFCVNLDPLLSWEAPEFHGTLRYRVYYRTYNSTAKIWRWRVVPGCEHLLTHSCRVSTVEVFPFETNDYAVASVLGNRSSELTKTDDFAPYIDGYIRAPNFTVEVEERKANLTISEPIRVPWSGEVLTSVLVDDFLQYKVQYWLKNQSHDEAYELTRDASDSAVQSISFPLRETQAYCFRLSLSGIQFRSYGWSEAHCTDDPTAVVSITPNQPALVLQIILGCLGGIAFILLVVATYLLAVKFTRFAKGDRTIPATLAAVMNQNDSFRFDKPDSQAAEEHVTPLVASKSRSPEKRPLRPVEPPKTAQPFEPDPSEKHLSEGKVPDAGKTRKGHGPKLPPSLKLLETVTEESGGFPEYVTAPHSPDSGLEDWESAGALTWGDEVA